MKKLFLITLSFIFLVSTTSVFADNHWSPPGLQKRANLPKGLEKKFDSFFPQWWNKDQLKDLCKTIREYLENEGYDLNDEETKGIQKDDYYGKFEECRNNELTLQLLNETKSFNVNSNVAVLFNNKEGDITNIEKDDILGIRLDKDGDIGYIRVYKELKEQTYTGKIKYVDNHDDLLVLEINKKYNAFTVDSDVKVKFMGHTSNLSQLEEGDAVTITLNNREEVQAIEVHRTVSYGTYEGIITEPYDDHSFEIMDEDHTKYSFDISSNFQVQFNDKKGSASDLKLGDPVEVFLDKDAEVIKVQVDRESDADIATGAFVRIYENSSSQNDNYIVIEDNDSLLIHYLDNTIDVYINEDKEDISDLRRGDKIRLELKSNKVEVIKAYR